MIIFVQRSPYELHGWSSFRNNGNNVSVSCCFLLARASVQHLEKVCKKEPSDASEYKLKKAIKAEKEAKNLYDAFVVMTKSDSEDDDDVKVVDVKNAASPDAFVPFDCPPCQVPVNMQQPLKGEKKTDFIDVSSLVPGVQNVWLKGPWVNFWCEDCGRKLAPRSIYEHWLKSHDDKNNLAGLQNLISVSMAKYKELSDKDAGAKSPPAKKQKLSAPDDSDTKLPKCAAAKAPPAKTTVKGPQLFGVRTQHHAKNPFFQYADKTPTNLAGNFSKEMWNDILNKMESSLTREQYKVAQRAIEQHFD